VLVVGGGGVALRKVEGLLLEGARVTVMARSVFLSKEDPAIGEALGILDFGRAARLPLAPRSRGRGSSRVLVTRRSR